MTSSIHRVCPGPIPPLASIPVRPDGMSDGAVLLTMCFNWMEPTDAIMEWVDWRPGLTFADLLEAHWPAGAFIDEGLDLAYFASGLELTEEEAEAYIVRPADGIMVAMVPANGGGGGGSNPIAVVGMLAVMVAAIATQQWYLATYGTTFTTAAGTTAYTTGSLVAASGLAAGVAIAGTAAISALMPSTRSGGASFDPLQSSANYGFSAQSNPTAQGGAIPVVQGEMPNILPTRLTAHLSTSGDKRYWNGLFILGHGEVEAFDITINGNPVANYDGVEVETRTGTMTQSVLPWFNDAITESTEGVTVQLSTTWYAAVLDQTGVTKLGFGVQCPGGLGHANNSNGLDPVTVQVQFQYRMYGATDWVDLGTVSITGSKREAIMRYYEFQVPAGRHEVRYRHPVAPPSTTLDISTTWLEYIHEIIPDDFRLPGCALLAIRALPTDKLNGSAPTVRCGVRRNTAMLPNGSGGTVSRPLSNPAWMALEVLTDDVWGAGEPASNIDIASFTDAATWCDQKNIAGRMYWDKQMRVGTAVDYLGQLGRFVVDRVGTRIMCVSDRPVAVPDASFLITSADILHGTLDLDYPGTGEEMADAVNVTWYGDDRNARTVFVPGDFFHAVTGRAPTVGDINLYACKDEATAQRAGIYWLRCNRYLTRVLKLSTKWRALGPHIRRGSVMQVAADRLMATQSGLVLESTPNTVKLNRPVQLEPGASYEVFVSHAEVAGDVDGVERVSIRTVQPVVESTVTNVLTITTPWDVTPSPDSTAAVGEVGRTVRWYRVTALSHGSDMTVEITGREYDPAVYADEGADPRTDGAANLPAVAGLLATIIDVTEDLVAKKVISLSWRGTAMHWQVWMRRLGSDATDWVYVDSTAYPAFVARNIAVGHMYRFAVTHTGSVADGQTVDVDYQMNSPSGAIRPVTALDGGVEVPVYALVGGEPQQVMGVFG